MNKKNSKNNKKKSETSKNKTAQKSSKNNSDVKQTTTEKDDLTLHQEKITSLTEANRVLKRKIFDLYTIFEINRNFSAVLDYQLLLDTFIFTSLAQVSASKSAIYLEKNHNENIFYLTKSRGSGIFPPETIPFDSNSELLVHLTKLNRPSRTEELIESISKEEERKILEKFIPGVIVPLVYQARLIGLFLISDKMSGRSFVDDDIEFLSILGNQISVAIENTRLYEAEKIATNQLRSTQEQLIHSERLAALGEMSAKVAHEINNPLGIIKNYLLLANKTVSDNPKALEFCGIVSEEIDRIANIVKELLEFHRPKGIDIKRVEVSKIITDVLHLADKQLEISNIKLVTKFDPDCPPVNASPDNLKQVFLNMIINAIDVMLEGGELNIAVEYQDKEVVISFCDTGPGVPPELIPRIFEPFFTTKDPTKGTGLGLSVCYGIIKRHKGTITYKNLDKGGCFEIRLPSA